MIPVLKRTLRVGLLGAALLMGSNAIATAASSSQAQDGFQPWLEGLRKDALAEGVSAQTLNQALAGLAPDAEVIKRDRRQPEFTLTFWRYLNNAVSERRIERARSLMTTHRPLLEEVRRKYGVQPRFLVAFWGLESNFGDYTGGFPVVRSLATLAHDPRRSRFFRRQLLDALKILDEGHIPLESMMGSWAGAMGQVQFIPSTFRAFAVDHDGDGRRDLWNSLPDIFASAANYLSSEGWKGDETWGREIKLPGGFDWNLTEPGTKKPLAEWQKLGVRRADGGDLPRADMSGAIVLPAGHQGPAFLVYGNFRTTMIWNRSTLYALAIGHLADRIAGKGPLLSKAVEENPLRYEELKEIQVLLAKVGFDTGKPDGIIGRNTRKALRAYQRQENLPPDGYPSRDLLNRLRRSADLASAQQ